MQFCIRDDDTSFFTSPEVLERAYGAIMQHGPVSLAVVPFCRAGLSKGVPEGFRGRWTVHRLDENAALVAYLRQRTAEGRIEIMLHGYRHDEPHGRPEFAAGRDLKDRVVAGRRYLEDLLNTSVRVFVPPHNTIGRQGLRAIATEGLHLGGTAGVRSGWPLLCRNTWSAWARLYWWRKSGRAGIPWVLDLGDHREIAGNAVTPQSMRARNEAAFKAALEIEGVFCAATHYWELPAASARPGEPSVGEQLNSLVERALSNSRVVWCSVGDAVTNPAQMIG